MGLEGKKINISQCIFIAKENHLKGVWYLREYGNGKSV